MRHAELAMQWRGSNALAQRIERDVARGGAARRHQRRRHAAGRNGARVQLLTSPEPHRARPSKEGSPLLAMASVKRSPGASYLPVHSGDVAAWEVQAKADFVRKTLGIVAAQAATACAFATAPLLSDSVRTFVLSHPGAAVAAMLLPLVLILVMFAVRHKHPWNYGVLALFTACTGYSLGVVATAYSPQAVVTALSLTASATAAMAALAYSLRNRNLSLLGLGLAAAGWMFLGALLAASFLGPAAGTGIALGAIGAVIFCAYTLFDLWLMMQHRAVPLDEHMLAALMLYVDLINLFQFILAVVGGTERS